MALKLLELVRTQQAQSVVSDKSFLLLAIKLFTSLLGEKSLNNNNINILDLYSNLKITWVEAALQWREAKMLCKPKKLGFEWEYGGEVS